MANVMANVNQKETPMTRGKGESSIYRRAADNMWCASIELPRGRDGKRRRKVIVRKRKPDVMAELRKHRETLQTHGDLATQSMSVEKWCAYWVEEVAAKHLTPNTVNGYRTAINQWIIPTIGRIKLDRLTPQHIRELHTTVMTTPKLKKHREMDEDKLPDGAEMLTSTYARLIHNTLSVCLKQAVQDGKISVNPCDKTSKPVKGTAQIAALDTDESIGLLKYLSTHPNGALWATYLLTGARRGEILGLTIDRVGEHLDLSWQLQHHTSLKVVPADWEYSKVDGQDKLYLCRPKSKTSWRMPPLVEPLKTILERHIGDRTEGFLFTRENGAPWDPLDATTEWTRVLADAGVTKPVPLHGLRHTAVDMLYELGVPEHVISEIVGHSARAVTRGYRTRGDMKRQTDALTALGKLLAVES